MPTLDQRIGLQDSNLRELVSFLIKQSRMSREYIADAMNSSLGMPGFISKRMLDDWTSECHKSARFPAFFIQAFCDAIGNDRLQRWAARPRLQKMIELAEHHLELEARRAELLKSHPQQVEKPHQHRKS